ncbi:MAG: PucR family transcriptional regulator ligand-binding domain-containing protein [Firmicutes bacterium]|nr:PucR family transcriptional regulator ligand-binding domain-containing protein [Bacillota bacterium]
MGLTIRAVLKIQPFTEARLLAGERGVDRVVERVDVVEVPDVRGWLRGGELLVTTGYSIKDDVRLQLNLIEEMYLRGSAGLVIKLQRYIKELSPEVIALADRYDIPIIDVPPHLPHSDITTPVLTQLLSRQTVLLQRTADIHRKLTGVVLKGEGMDAIAQHLADAVERAVLIEDEMVRVLAAAVPSRWRQAEGMTRTRVEEWRSERGLGAHGLDPYLQGAAKRRNVVCVPAQGSAPLRVIAPIIVDDDVAGYVTLVGGRKAPGELDMLAVEQASIVAALEMVKKRAVEEARGRLQADAIQDIISSNFESPDLMVRRARALNWDITRLNTAVVVDIDRFQRLYLAGDKTLKEAEIQAIKRRLLDVVREVLSRWDPGGVTAAQSDNIVILTCARDQGDGAIAGTKELGQEIRRQVAARVPPITVSVGIGRPHAPVVGLAKSYREARQALRIGRIVFADEGVFHYDDLGLYRLLFDPGRLRDLEAYYRETLAPLDEYDQRHGTHFSETLQRYVENDGNAVRTAEELFVHRNTLGYRLRRIENILGIDLSQPDARLNLLLAFKVKRILAGETRLNQGLAR